MQELVDPRFQPVVAAIRARAGAFVRQPGARPTTTLGVGNAVFMGGISVAEPGGTARVVVPARPIWIWPALIGGAWVVIVSILALAVDGPAWLTLALVGLMTVVLGPVALVALAVAWRQTRRKLVIDARGRTLDELDGARTVLRVPAELMRAVRVQSFENSDRAMAYDVLIDVGFADLWVHQEGTAEAATKLAHTVGAALLVRLDPEVLHHP